MRSRYTFIFILLCFIASCAQAPTRIYEKSAPGANRDSILGDNKIVLTDKTIVVDARPSFEFALSHPVQAVNIEWTMFTNARAKYAGLLKNNLSDEIKRLSLLGLEPGGEIVVVGSGLKGRGEEGRVAWTLAYLGFKNVRIADIETLGFHFGKTEMPPRLNAKIWQPEYRENLLAQKAEVIKAAVGRKKSGTHIIDVRTHNEFFARASSLEYQAPDLRALNIEWKEFYTKEGRPNPAIIERLKSVQIGQSDRIIIISQRGIRSAAVAFALSRLGFNNVANYAGGYEELLGSKQ